MGGGVVSGGGGKGEGDDVLWIGLGSERKRRGLGEWDCIDLSYLNFEIAR